MPNTRRNRKIQSPPLMDGFKPYGVRMKNLEKVIMLFEEYEAIRLIDHEDLNQEEAAVRMDVSRPTFTRIYKKARKTVAKALVEGKALLIEGGTYISENYWVRCSKCSRFTTAPNPPKNCPHCHSQHLKDVRHPE